MYADTGEPLSGNAIVAFDCGYLGQLVVTLMRPLCKDEMQEIRDR